MGSVRIHKADVSIAQEEDCRQVARLGMNAFLGYFKSDKVLFSPLGMLHPLDAKFEVNSKSLCWKMQVVL